jgi:diaminobutyrate-2-oxoglutarate transaminase
MFAVEHTDTIPDIITMSKALGGIGLPISGIAYKEKLNTWPSAQHIGTFRGNVAAYAGGAAALDFMVTTRLADHAATLGDQMLSSLRELQRDSRIVGDVRGKGLMLGIEFVRDKDTKEPHPEAARAVRSVCHRHGLLTEVGGHYNNVARFLPPLVLTHELAERGVAIFIDAVMEVEGSAKPA